MSAPKEAVEAVQTALGCRRGQFVLLPGEPWGCATHAQYRDHEWTDRGCPVAVAAADAGAPHIAAQTLRDAALDSYQRGDIGKPDGGVEAWVWLRGRADQIAVQS